MPYTDHFYELVARLSDAGAPGQAAILGMHLSKMRVGDGGLAKVLPAETCDFAGLAAVMRDEDLAAIKAAVDAEIAGRA